MENILFYLQDIWDQSGYAENAACLAIIIAFLGVLPLLWNLGYKILKSWYQHKLTRDLFPFFIRPDLKGEYSLNDGQTKE